MMVATMIRTLKVFVAILLCLAVISLVQNLRDIFPELREYSIAREQYRTLREAVLPHAQPSSEPQDSRRGIDFDALLAINPDVVGWIEIVGSDISYPVVQTQDNSHYLNHTFEGHRNRSGAIFLDRRDNSDFLSLARVYGHNMRDGSMFGTLSDWQGDKIIIHTLYARYEFSVIERVMMSEPQVQRLADSFGSLALITCVSNRRNFRYIVFAEIVRG